MGRTDQQQQQPKSIEKTRGKRMSFNDNSLVVVAVSSATTTTTYRSEPHSSLSVLFVGKGIPGPNFPVLIFIFVIIEK
jgi:hypothetical protein